MRIAARRASVGRPKEVPAALQERPAVLPIAAREWRAWQMLSATRDRDFGEPLVIKHSEILAHETRERVRLDAEAIVVADVAFIAAVKAKRDEAKQASSTA